MQCSQEFLGDLAYEEHKRSGHRTIGISLNPVPAGIPVEAVADQSFIDNVERINREKQEGLAPTTHNDNPNQAPDGSKLEVPEPKQIQLTYVYTGECPTCRKPVSTIELDVKDAHFVVAYCETCKKQLHESEEKNLK